MPAGNPTLAENLQLGDGNIDDIQVDDLLVDAPLLAAMPVKKSSFDTSHEYLARIASPDVGFREIDAGMNSQKGTREKRTTVLKYIDGSVTMDKALYDTNGGPELWRQTVEDNLQGALQQAEKQLIYGTGNKAAGFNGLANVAQIATLAGGMVVNAAGTANRTSVYIIRFGGADVSLLGPDGTVQIDIEETFDTLAVDPTDATKSYNAKQTPIAGWMGLQPGSAFSVSRIANINAAEDAPAANRLTDSLITKALMRHKSRRPSLIVMGYEALGQLQDSRVATSETGREAPIPTEVHGVPILATPNISVAETAVA